MTLELFQNDKSYPHYLKKHLWCVLLYIVSLSLWHSSGNLASEQMLNRDFLTHWFLTVKTESQWLICTFLFFLFCFLSPVVLLCKLALRSCKVRPVHGPWLHAWPERCGRCTQTCPRQWWSPAAHAAAGLVSAHPSACPNAAWQTCLWSFRSLCRSAGCRARCAQERSQSPFGKAWQGSSGWMAATGSGRTQS